jgi:hypothetical protein
VPHFGFLGGSNYLSSLPPRPEDRAHESEGDQPITAIDKDITRGLVLEKPDDGNAAKYPDPGQEAVHQPEPKIDN